MRQRLARSVIIAAVAMVVAFGVSRVWSAGAYSISFDAIHWPYAALSVASTLVFVLVYAICWWMVMCAIERRRVPFVATVRLFLLTWPGRYVPASLPHYGGRLVAGPGAGLTRPAVAASLVYENIFAIVGAGALSIGLLAIGYRDALGGSAWLVAALVAAPIAALALHPAVARGAIRVGACRVKRLATLEQHVLGPAALLRIGAAYMVGSVFAGLAFWSALRAVGSDAPLPLAIAAYNIGGVAGMLAIAVPSGIGVREGVVVAVMGAVVSPPVALSAAVLARLAGVVADFTPFALILLIHAVRRMRRPAPLPAVKVRRSRAA